MSDPTTTPPPAHAFHPDPPPLSPAFADLLTTYAHIPPPQHATHLTTLRNRAFATYPYPCLGRWRFLSLDLATHPQYAPVLSHVRDHGAVFLDLGCCLGQDVRKLVFDLLQSNSSPAAAPPARNEEEVDAITHRIYGADLQPAFIDAGYALFNDEAVLPPSQFLRGADVLDTSPSNVLAPLDGKVSVVHITAVFHLFDWDKQMRVAGRVLRLLRRKTRTDTTTGGRPADGEETGEKEGARALVLGCQVGGVQGQEVGTRSGGGSMYRHDGNSWRRLWEEVVGGEEWQGVVKGVEVHSELRKPGKLHDSRWGEEMRWHVWHVWVDFF